MSLNLIDKLHAQARKTSKDDVNKLCHSIADCLPDQGVETMASLRQLSFVLQAKDVDTRIPTKTVKSMFQAVTSLEKGKLKECLICQRIMREALPQDTTYEECANNFKYKIPSIFHLHIFENTECIARMVGKTTKWLQTQEYEIERRVFSFIVLASIIYSHLISSDTVKVINEELSRWLQEASLYQAINPYSSNPFRKDEKSLVTEVDGTSSTNFFTVLCIGQYYTDDQMVNIYTFSLLYQWITHSQRAILANVDQLPHSTVLDDSADDISVNKELALYLSQTRPIRPSSATSWMSKSVSVGWGSSPTSHGSHMEKQSLRKTTSLSGQHSSSPRSISSSDQAQRLNASSLSDTPLEKCSIEDDRSRTDSLRSSSIGASDVCQNITSTVEGGQSIETTSEDSLRREETPTSISPVADAESSVETSRGYGRQWTPTAIQKTASVLGESMGFGVEENMLPVFEVLAGRTVDYCFRILDQCDRKPKVATDSDLQTACQLEAVKLLDLVCRIDSAHVPKTFRELKRFITASGHEHTSPSLLIVILQFLINHSRAVAYDPQQELKILFHHVLLRNFTSPTLSFDITMFILDNLETLTHTTDFMITYFPNILKIVAWNPHTFVSDFTELVPAMMSPATSVELFHSIIDLPCMTVALEITDRTKNIDMTTFPPSTNTEPVRAMDAFKNALFRPMFNFYTRAESGHGDTIDRLDQFHSSIQDMMEHPQVLVCCQAAPVLLRCWFNVIVREASEEFVCNLITVFIERMAQVYGILEYKNDIRRIISEYSVVLIKKFPRCIILHLSEITQFLSNTGNIPGQEMFFSQLVWGVGEYLSTSYSSDCSPKVISQTYESLEVVTYEVIGVTGCTPQAQAPYTLSLVSTLMATLAKLASRCQDLIPRAILCLTKVAKQHSSSILDKESKDVILNKAQELINLLKLPNFASVILNPPVTLETDRVHMNGDSPATLLRTTHRLVAPTV